MSEKGHILTNNHVTEGCRSLVIRSPGGQQQDASVVKSDKSNDLALLLAPSAPQSLAEFESEVHLGERVFAFGYPLAGFLASSGTFTDGSVSSLEGIGDDSRMLQISAPVQPGNSGGPLLNEKGAIIGIVTSKADAIAVANETKDIPQNINFAIKSSVALSFMQSADVKPRVMTRGSLKNPSDIATLGKAISVMVICKASSNLAEKPPPNPPPSDKVEPAINPPAQASRLDYSNCAVVLEAVKTCERLRDCSNEAIETNFTPRERQHFQSISGTAAFTADNFYSHCEQVCSSASTICAPRGTYCVGTD